ncbi:MAG: hypothetical protein ACRDNB_07775 [Gaiellaceae bacterium]
MRRTKILIGIGALLLGVGAAVVVAAPGNFNVPWRTPLKSNTYTGQHFTLTDNLATYNETILATFSKPDVGENFDTLRVQCHGGKARVTWYVGNLEPRVANTGIHISILMDGRVIGTLLKGGKQGVWEDGPASIETAVFCPRGRRAFTARIASIDGVWGMPYANSTDRVQRGFIVFEVWK